MTKSSSTRESVERVIVSVMQDAGRSVEGLASDDRLREDLQLDSLDLAVVVIRLQDELGVDPFRQSRRTVRTIEDLIDVYTGELTTTD